MNVHALSYPSLQRRLIADRRSRALFLARTTQQVRSTRALLVEIARAAAALATVAAWAALLIVLAA
jgi:hypothetical protein